MYQSAIHIFMFYPGKQKLIFRLLNFLSLSIMWHSSREYVMIFSQHRHSFSWDKGIGKDYDGQLCSRRNESGLLHKPATAQNSF